MADPACAVRVTLPGRVPHCSCVSGVNSVGPTLTSLMSTKGTNTLRQCGGSWQSPPKWSPSLCHFWHSDPGSDKMHPLWMRTASGPKMARTSGSQGAFSRKKSNEANELEGRGTAGALEDEESVLGGANSSLPPPLFCFLLFFWSLPPPSFPPSPSLVVATESFASAAAAAAAAALFFVPLDPARCSSAPSVSSPSLLKAGTTMSNRPGWRILNEVKPSLERSSCKSSCVTVCWTLS
mmetsp:Transcript_56510/g.97304  ORF Transcript_56510/g.97304 Transcript_56510/m.97304 type:complete len:237 (+) Transcript_56510:488-1198(+)